MKTPKVTVLMPVYNGEKFLSESIESILKQDFRDFEFLIINDGSTDKSGEIISSYKDSRIRYIINEKNSGLISTLNKGLDLASGEYVARMDCDDISTKNRLSVQVKFMDENKKIGASGSYYFLMRGKKKAVADVPLNDKEIISFFPFNCPLAHPTVIIRVSLIEKYNLRYSYEYEHSEDYDLWSRIAGYSQLANLPNKLLNYRMHDNQITGSADNASKRHDSVSAIRTRHLNLLGVQPSKEELDIHNILSDGVSPAMMDHVIAAEQWLLKLISVNDEKKTLDKYYFQKIIMERWLRLCFNFFQGREGLKYFLNSEIYARIKLPAKRKSELIKSIYYSWRRLRIKN